MRNEVGKLPFLLVIRSTSRYRSWVRSQPERRKMQEEDFTLDEWGIYKADCYASNLQLPLFLCGHAHIIAVKQSVRNTFPSKVWYVANDTGIPFMVDP